VQLDKNGDKLAFSGERKHANTLKLSAQSLLVCTLARIGQAKGPRPHLRHDIGHGAFGGQVLEEVVPGPWKDPGRVVPNIH
jgi:hypothetical protein